MDESSAVYAAANELGFGVDDGTDASSNVETEAQNTEVESEVKAEGTDAIEGQGEGNSEESASLEGEETKEAPIEEPKLTVKEFQEIQAAREQLERQQKAFMEEKAQLEKEFQEKFHDKVKVHDEIDSFFAQLATNDPDLFDLVKGAFQEHQKQFSNPVLDQLRQETQSLRQELDSFKSRASDQVTLTKLDAEFNKFASTIGKEAETAGLKIDRKVIEDMWTKGLSVEEAFYAKYGAAFAKAKESKAKVETVEKKIAARPAVATAGSVNRSTAPTQAKIPNDAFGAVRHFAKQLTGKSY